MAERSGRDGDQAAGLRRLFGGAPARLAPILVDPAHPAEQVASIVRLAQASANAGTRTLVVDCARAQVAASLGLRARFDLVHALRGECGLHQVRLDGGPDLGVIPAARAAQAPGAQADFLGWLAAVACHPTADLVLLAIEPAQASLLRASPQSGEVLVPMPRRRAACGALLRALAKAGDGTDIAGFRLLFPAWDADTAARLFEELVVACTERLGIELRFGGAVRVTRDWLRVTHAMNDWQLLQLPRSQTVRTF